jgi:hypothetical protein
VTRVALVVLLLLLVLAAPAGAAVEKGQIQPNRGAVGVTLGMTRAQVIARLGKPLYTNANGYMQFAKVNLFDVYLNVSTNRVRLIGIAGRRFCIQTICLQHAGNVGALKKLYGANFRAITDEDGSSAYAMYGTLGGRKVFTTFGVASHRAVEPVIQVFIGYCPSPAPCPGKH